MRPPAVRVSRPETWLTVYRAPSVFHGELSSMTRSDKPSSDRRVIPKRSGRRPNAASANLGPIPSRRQVVCNSKEMRTEAMLGL